MHYCLANFAYGDLILRRQLLVSLKSLLVILTLQKRNTECVVYTLLLQKRARASLLYIWQKVLFGDILGLVNT